MKWSSKGKQMKVGRIVGALFLAVLVGCSSRSPQPPPSVGPGIAELKTPTKEILVTGGDLNKPYDILGEVECKSPGQSVYSMGGSGGAGMEPTGELKELLRKVAFTKYGERVDAIINAKTGGGISGGFGGAFIAAYGAKTAFQTAQGIAVSFQRETTRGKTTGR